MDFTSVQRSHVEQALADLAAGVALPGFRDSTTYDVVHQGRPFPPKLLIALAPKHATGGTTSVQTALALSAPKMGWLVRARLVWGIATSHGHRSVMA